MTGTHAKEQHVIEKQIFCWKCDHFYFVYTNSHTEYHGLLNQARSNYNNLGEQESNDNNNQAINDGYLVEQELINKSEYFMICVMYKKKVLQM